MSAERPGNEHFEEQRRAVEEYELLVRCVFLSTTAAAAAVAAAAAAPTAAVAAILTVAAFVLSGGGGVCCVVCGGRGACRSAVAADGAVGGRCAGGRLQQCRRSRWRLGGGRRVQL